MKVHISFRAPAELLHEIRGAVVSIQQTDPSFSRTKLLKWGAELALTELRARFNRGKAFRKLKGPIASGRRPVADEDA